ncbi:Transcriptional adapter 2B [Armadillidium vulgare]|nr:Transcriptional adapter 2B [Armadillidium vulgare]
MAASVDTFAKYHCNYCEEDINGLRVRCLECEDFDLCLQCFACGAQIGKHKAHHGYQFMASVFQDTGNFSVLPGQGQWTAREEVRLLDAIEQYGYGNWVDISKHIETRTAEEARLKYINCYIEGSVGKLTWRTLESRQNLPIESATLDAGPLSPTLGSSIPNQEMNLEETSILGYMINRDDFEREWDNEAETSIAPLFIHPVDDDEIDMALKLAQVDMYIRRLRERARRKRVVRDFNLPQKFFKKEKEKATQNTLKKRSKDEKYRRNGIQHVEECSEFEVARARRDKKKENKKKGTMLLHQIPTTVSDSHARLREDERSPRNSVERRSTALDTGGGKWLSGSFSDSSISSSSNSCTANINSQQILQTAGGGTEDIVDISTLPGFHLLSLREKKEEGDRQLNGGGIQQSSRPSTTLVGLDTRSQVHVSSFIAQAGWISLCS